MWRRMLVVPVYRFGIRIGVSRGLCCRFQEFFGFEIFLPATEGLEDFGLPLVEFCRDEFLDGILDFVNLPSVDEVFCEDGCFLSSFSVLE